MDLRTTREVASIVVLAAIPTLVAIALDIVILTGIAPTVYIGTNVDRAPHETDGPRTTEHLRISDDDVAGRGDPPGAVEPGVETQ